jgi:hemerythrin
MATEWTSELSTGMPELDIQHEAILELIDEAIGHVEAGGRERLSDVLSNLADGFYRHFSSEETLMEASDYPERRTHKAAHDLFLQDLALHLDEYARTGPTPQLTAWMRENMASWFKYHIRQNDIPLARHILQRTGRPAEHYTPRPKPVKQ